MFRPVSWLVVAGMLGAMFLWSCGQEQPLVPDQPLTTAGVPTIRVLLTGRAVRKAALSTTAGYRLMADGRCVNDSHNRLKPTPLVRSGRTWTLGEQAVEAEGIDIVATSGSYVVYDGRVYRGRLALLPVGANRFKIVNHVGLESYLAGVLPKELYHFWATETYRALAVAARTFAAYQMKTFGRNHEYDLGSGQASQVYGGVSAETDKSWSAARYTHGVVLAYGPAGAERIFLTQYSSCCGGRVNGAYVLRNAENIPPLLGGQVCTDCRKSPKYRWGLVRIRLSDVYRAIVASFPSAGELGGLADVKVISNSNAPNGRAVWADAVGADGKAIRIRCDDLRLALLRSGVPAARKLYSMNCRVSRRGDYIEFTDGRGFGHGVGLCQWGTQGKAVKGWTARRILANYYPQAKLFRAY